MISLNASLKVKTFFVQNPILGADARNAEWFLGAVYGNCDFPTYFNELKASDSAYLEHYRIAYDQIIKYNDYRDREE